MDRTGQPLPFIVPDRTDEQREGWNATWCEVGEVLVSMAEGERESVRALLAQDVHHEEPRTWMQTWSASFSANPQAQRLSA